MKLKLLRRQIKKRKGKQKNKYIYYIMGFFKYIDIKYFIISLVLGLFFVYMTLPDNRKIYIYPTPENVEILQYKDTVDNCFSVEKKEVVCPTDKSEIANIKPQV
tara:strand:+ start:1935 stop:2246 length:312 start_codon:yes stop_codon:yes gene_type:complete